MLALENVACKFRIVLKPLKVLWWQTDRQTDNFVYNFWLMEFAFLWYRITHWIFLQGFNEQCVPEHRATVLCHFSLLLCPKRPHNNQDKNLQDKKERKKYALFTHLYLRIHMIFKGQNKRVGRCLERTFSDGLDHFLKTQRLKHYTHPLSPQFSVCSLYEQLGFDSKCAVTLVKLCRQKSHFQTNQLSIGQGGKSMWPSWTFCSHAKSQTTRIEMTVFCPWKFAEQW